MFAVCLKRDSKSIFFATTTTIHIFGLIKVTATITPVDSESNNYVYVKTPGSSTQALQLLKLGKSTDKNYENIILTVKHGMNLIFLFCFVLRSKDKHLMTNIEKTTLSISVVLNNFYLISRRLRSHQSSPRKQWGQAC